MEQSRYIRMPIKWHYSSLWKHPMQKHKFKELIVAYYSLISVGPIIRVRGEKERHAGWKQVWKQYAASYINNPGSLQFTGRDMLPGYWCGGYRLRSGKTTWFMHLMLQLASSIFSPSCLDKCRGLSQEAAICSLPCCSGMGQRIKNYTCENSSGERRTVW